MQNRSFFLIAALGLLASSAFVTPSQAGTTFSYTITPTAAQTITATSINGGSGSTTFTASAGGSATVPPDASIKVATFTETATGVGLDNTFMFHGGQYSASNTVSQSVNITLGAVTKSFTVTESMGNSLVWAGNLVSPSVTTSGPIIIGNTEFVITQSSVVTPVSGTKSISIEVTAVTVPEPASMALLGIGMTSFLAFRRFFKRSSVA